jgi:replication initiation protein RepC
MHSYTQTVNGFGGSRRLSAEIIAFQDRFNVPPKLDMLGRRHGQVLAGFKEAARYMGLPARVIQAVDYLFRFTRVEDWIGDAKPIVWPSNREMGEALGLTLSGIKKLNRRLIELGFVTAKDSPTGVRWGRRGHNGQILVAYGFDLSPLALRAEEFADLRDAGRADDAARADLRRRKTIALRSIGQLVRTAIEQGFDTAELLVCADQARAIAPVADHPGGTLAYGGYVASIEAVHQAVKALFDTLVQSSPTAATTTELGTQNSESTPAGPFEGTRNNNYKHTTNPMDSIGQERGSSAFGEDGALTAPPKEQPKLPTVKPKEIIELAPVIATYLGRPLEGLDDRRAIETILRAAEDCAAQNIGVSNSLWREAQTVLGLWGAVLALTVVASKDPEHFSRTPAHYFAGMIERAKQGTLRLDRSIWGLRTRGKTLEGRA